MRLAGPRGDIGFWIVLSREFPASHGQDQGDDAEQDSTDGGAQDDQEGQWLCNGEKR